MKEEEKIDRECKSKAEEPGNRGKDHVKYTIPKETIHFLKFPKLMYYQMGVRPPSNTNVKSWGCENSACRDQLVIGTSPDRRGRWIRECRYDSGRGRALWHGVAILDWPWVLGWEGGGGMVRWARPTRAVASQLWAASREAWRAGGTRAGCWSAWSMLGVSAWSCWMEDWEGVCRRCPVGGPGGEGGRCQSQASFWKMEAGNGQGTGRKRGEAKQLFQACGNGCVVAERKLLGEGRGRGTKNVVAAWACVEKEQQPGCLQVVQSWDTFQEKAVASGDVLELVGHILRGADGFPEDGEAPLLAGEGYNIWRSRFSSLSFGWVNHFHSSRFCHPRLYNKNLYNTHRHSRPKKIVVLINFDSPIFF